MDDRRWAADPDYSDDDGVGLGRPKFDDDWISMDETRPGPGRRPEFDDAWIGLGCRPEFRVHELEDWISMDG